MSCARTLPPPKLEVAEPRTWVRETSTRTMPAELWPSEDGIGAAIVIVGAPVVSGWTVDAHAFEPSSCRAAVRVSSSVGSLGVPVAILPPVIQTRTVPSAA
jgi:hypothetical protein